MAQSGQSYVVEALEQRTLFDITSLVDGFGVDGTATTSRKNEIRNAHAIAIQADGKILVAGDATLGSGPPYDGFFVARFNTDGSLDDGSVTDTNRNDHFGTGGKFVLGYDTASFATAMAIQKDGKIIVGGYADSDATANFPAQQYWLMIRLNVDGSLDTTFGDGGKEVSQFGISNTPLNAIAIQNDGKIVVAGSWDGDWLIARFKPNGDIDGDFAIGYTTTDFGGVDTVGGLAIDGIGRIVVAGGVQGVGSAQRVGLARYLPNGDPDESFGTDGKYIVDPLATRKLREVTGLVIRPNGNLVVSHSFLDTLHSMGQNGWSGGWIAVDDAGGNVISDSWREGSKVNGIALMPNGNYAYAAELQDVIDQPALGLEFSPLVPRPTLTNSSYTAVAVAPDGSIFEAGFIDIQPGTRAITVSKYKGFDPLSWGAIKGNIFNDKDGDRVKDANEKGLGHVLVYIDTNGNGQWDGVYHEAYSFTDINGDYIFPNLDIGSYSVRQELPAGYKQQSPASPIISAAAHLGETTAGYNFVDTPIVLASTKTAINGSVFNDWNSDGKRQISKPTEPDLAKITVFIDANKNGRLDANELKTTTDGGGNYSLALSKAGGTRIAVVLPKGWLSTTPAFYDVNVAVHTQAIERFGLAVIDPDDSIAELARATPLVLGKGIADALDSGLDVNLYRFTVKAGQTIAFDLDLLKGSKLDAYLRLFDSTGVQLAANNNAAAPGERKSGESYIKFKFTTAGTYYIGVSAHLNSAYNAVTGKGDIDGGTLGTYLLNTVVS